MDPNETANAETSATATATAGPATITDAELADRLPDVIADVIADLVDTWVRDTFHGSAISLELSETSHNRILAARETLKERLRTLFAARA